MPPEKQGKDSPRHLEAEASPGAHPLAATAMGGLLDKDDLAVPLHPHNAPALPFLLSIGS